MGDMVLVCSKIFVFLKIDEGYAYMDITCVCSTRVTREVEHIAYIEIANCSGSKNFICRRQTARKHFKIIVNENKDELFFVLHRLYVSTVSPVRLVSVYCVPSMNTRITILHSSLTRLASTKKIFRASSMPANLRRMCMTRRLTS